RRGSRAAPVNATRLVADVRADERERTDDRRCLTNRGGELHNSSDAHGGRKLPRYNLGHMNASRPMKVLRYDAGVMSAEQDAVALEEPLEVRVRGRAVSITMRTPGHDDELAAGFLLSEGMIHRAADVLRIEACGRNEA